MSSIFPKKEKNHLESKLFFDEGVNVARYDKVKYPIFTEFTKKQVGFFWQPEEFEIYRDIKEFKELSKAEQHIFTSNLKRQILLDSVQGRGPVSTFGQVVSLPELEVWLTTWQFFETIHSRSYTYIIKNIYSNSGKIFDEMLDIKELIDCTDQISYYYDDFSNKINLLKQNKIDLYEVKRSLWLALISVNVLEGIRFYTSFACSWAFAETKRMEGNAKIIKFIARDESIHLGSTQQLIKILPKDDEDFVKIQNETIDETINIFKLACEQEVIWVDYLFKYGSMLGLNEVVLKNHIYWITNKRLKAINLPELYDIKTNSLPWTQNWLNNNSTQVALQESENESYIIGGLKNDLTPEFLKTLKI